MYYNLWSYKFILTFILHFAVNECVNTNEDTRIINGTEAKYGQFPFVVGIIVRPGGVLCTGFIIAPTWVVTAAHCYGRVSLKKANTTVRAGTLDLAHLKQYVSQERLSKRHFIHPSYTATHNDIALVEVQKRFTYNKYVNEMTIAESPMPKNRLPCLSIGFGKTDPKRGGNTRLFYIETAGGGRKYCNTFAQHVSTWEEMHVCSRPVYTTTSTCDGDSGGPLVCNDLLVGVLCGRMSLRPLPPNTLCGHKDSFQVYMFVGFYESWIKKHVKGIKEFENVIYKRSLPLENSNPTNGCYRTELHSITRTAIYWALIFNRIQRLRH